MPPNPYLDEIVALFGEAPVDDISLWRKYDRALEDTCPDMSRFTRRDRALEKYGFAIPNEAAFDALAQRGPIIEVGAGLGYWAWCLRERGVDVLACDVGETWPWSGREPWTEIMRADGRLLAAECPERTLFLCWPSMERWPAQVLSAYRGNTVVIVGESDYGCTGDRALFRLLSWRWNEVEEIAIPVWPGIHDRMTIYERKG
jgi:hypothetical protein